MGWAETPSGPHHSTSVSDLTNSLVAEWTQIPTETLQPSNGKSSQNNGGYSKLEQDVHNAHIGLIIRCPQTFGHLSPSIYHPLDRWMILKVRSGDLRESLVLWWCLMALPFYLLNLNTFFGVAFSCAKLIIEEAWQTFRPWWCTSLLMLAVPTLVPNVSTPWSVPLLLSWSSSSHKFQSF